MKISFEQYLVNKGPEDCPHLLLNSLQFWMEVHKFQVRFMIIDSL